MNECALPAGITAVACAIAQQIDDIDDLTLLSSVLMQLADTLATIAAQRAKCNK